MKYLMFGDEKPTYKICILVNDIKKDEIERLYIKPYGLNKEEIIIIDLHQAVGKKKTPMSEMRAYINEELTEVLDNLQVEYLLVGDSEYFKAFTKSTQADKMIGYMVPSATSTWKCFYVPNYRTVFYDPEKINHKIKLAITAMLDYMNGSYIDPGIDIIRFSEYPETVEDIEAWLNKLIQKDVPLTHDIEAFSLKHYSAGIGTVCFAWSETEGIAFAVDYGNEPDVAEQIRSLLKAFYERFNNKLIYHQISFDVTVLIYQLFMNHLLDTAGMLTGLEVMLKNWDDTKLITYLATNSCAGNKLGLKDQAQEYAGNYAQEEIKDINKIPLPKLLQYNLVDGLSTWFVYNKHWQTVINDNQVDIYENIFKPAIIDIIQMQLTGMPLDMNRVKEVKSILQNDYDIAMNKMNNSVYIQKFSHHLVEEYVNKKNNKWKTKRTTVTETLEQAKTNEKIRKEITFNPNSDAQVRDFLYEQLGLPIIETTDTGLGGTGNDVLKALKNHTEDPLIKEFLDALVDFNDVNIIITTFIAAFERAEQGPDGHYYLFGNFNLGGTVSGRLSSNGPNLQNLPATGSKYAKIIKSCFVAPKGWLFCGIDFNSLEDRISALTTKDPNKLKVYTDGYDGHCLRAQAYFGDKMPDIDPNDVNSINSIKDKYPEDRQESKTPTFALTYQGTYITLMKNNGFSKEKAQLIESRYHELYKVSDQYIADKLNSACKDGYVTVAFGLRVRTPLLEQVIRGTSKTPFAAEAEGRTAGNAMGQSWCLLNNRASSEFMGKVRKSKYRLDIRPSAHIHDAQYYLIRDDLETLMYANEHLIKAVEWQDHPEIQHDQVKLGGELSIFYPDWSKECGIPNNATEEQITESIQKHINKLQKG